MSTYGNLIARIADEIGRPELSARIPEAIQSAIRFYEDERFWFLEGESTASTINAQQNYALPDDFVEPDSLTITYSDGVRRLLTRRPWPWMRQNSLYTTTSLPSDWAYYADQIWLWPIPDGIYTLTMSFLKRLDALDAYSDTNDWMVHGERLIRAQVKQDLYEYAASQQLDPRMTQRDMGLAEMWRGRVKAALDDLRSKSEQKIAAGMLSVDPGLMTTRGSYDINYE